MRDLIRSQVNDRCLLEAEAVHAYAVHGTAPEAVVAPHDAEEAGALLKFASAEGLTVECAGAGTRLRGGNTPRKIDIVMTSARLKAVAEYEPADLVIAVGAGAALTDVENAVAPHNQFLALDPAVTALSTLGATIATGAAGPLRCAHGTPRDQVLGLEVVTGDGRILRFGGRVVKNVAGYDLVRLMVGSRGTLGFITRANLRLKPQPEVDRTIGVQGASFVAVADIADAIKAAALEPAALEIVSGAFPQQSAPESHWTLLARFHGNQAAVADAHRRVAELAGGASTFDVAASEWRTLAAREAAAPVQLRLAQLPSQLRDTAAIALGTAQAAGLRNARLAIHASDGIVRVLAEAAPADCAAVLLQERATMEQHGGTFIVERMPHGMELDAFGHAEGARIMAQIKNVFDPAGILAPGRFVA